MFKLWVEVKQTGNDDGVEPSTIGRHLVRATNEEVQKLVFVTNADYTLAMRREIERFAHRVVLDYALISGGNYSKSLAARRRCSGRGAYQR